MKKPRINLSEVSALLAFFEMATCPNDWIELDNRTPIQIDDTDISVQLKHRTYSVIIPVNSQYKKLVNGFLKLIIMKRKTFTKPDDLSEQC